MHVSTSHSECNHYILKTYTNKNIGKTCETGNIPSTMTPSCRYTHACAKTYIHTHTHRLYKYEEM